MGKYQHAEAFMLMLYRSDDGTEEEYIWNSRDGVTPFVVTLRSGKMATHKEWHKDRRVVDYKPKPGERIFVDLTEERRRELQLRNARRYWPNVVGVVESNGEYAELARKEFSSPEAIAEFLMQEPE